MTTKSIPHEAYRFATPANIAKEGDKTRFSGIAYTGDILSHPFWGEVAFELTSITPPQKLPMLIGHDREQNAGFSESVTVGDDVQVSGVLLSNKHGARIKQDADEGFPWQMSVHIDSRNIEEVGKGDTCNGRTFSKAGVIFKDSTFREISFTPTGVDANTSASVFAFTYSDFTKQAQQQFQQGQSPELDLGKNNPKHDKEGQTMTEQEAAALQASHDALKAENEGMKSKFSALETAHKQFTDKVAADAKTKREADVKALFSDIGKEHKDEAAKPFIAMEASQFSAMAGLLREQHKSSAPNHLFQEQNIQAGEQGEDKIMADMQAALAAEQGA